MEFLKVFAIPHSEPVLKLIEILFFLGFSIFILYSAYLLGSTIYGLLYYLKGSRQKDEYYLNIAQNYIAGVSKGYVAFLGLGLVPMLSVHYSILQFSLNAPDFFFYFLYLSILFFVLTVVFLKLLYKFFKKSQSLVTLLFAVSILSIQIFAYLTIGIFNIAFKKEFALVDINFVQPIGIDFLVRILIFLAISVVVSSLAYIFKTYNADVVAEKGQYFQENGVIKRNLSNVLIAGNILPVLLFLLFLTTPKGYVLQLNYILIVAALLLLLLVIITSYFSLKENKVSFAKYSFLFSIVSFMFLFGFDTSLLTVSNKVQEYKIAKEYIAYHEQILASAGRNIAQEVNGEEIYKAKCVACHQFDTRLVGPPHKEVLKKYENRKEDMVKFILNPVKVDPNYPPMPSQGLKPNEAEAVVKYMFEHYGPMLK